MRSLLMKAGILVFAFGVAGCSGQGARSVPQQPDPRVPAAGPALQAPPLRKPLDVIGGPALFSTLNTLLGDAAPVVGGKPLAHFYIGVREIDAIVNGQTVVLGSASTPYQMDLLQYQNGSTAWMTQTSIPMQTYTQLRYVIDIPSTQAIFADGTSSLPVKFTGGSTKSSYGVGYNTTTTADPAYPNAADITVDGTFAIQSSTAAIAGDFNLTESLANNGSYILLRPTIAASTAGGQISGTVANASGTGVQNATVVAVASNGNAVSSATTDANGAFDIHTLSPDTYQLVIYNSYTNAAGDKIYSSGATSGAQGFYGPSATVTAGSTVSAGTIAD